MEKAFLGFWEKLPRPFFVLAPLANVTDAAFRQFIVKYKRPDVLWTEFVAADGLCHPKGRLALSRDLRYEENERPIVAQLFTGDPDKMFRAARMVRELKFDGLDINMGCPDKNVMKQGAGAACMCDVKNAEAVIRAAMSGVGGEIPVSVKTRLGDVKDELETWLPAILETQLAAVTLHARTRKEMSAVPAHWERVKRAVEIAKGSGTLIIGNGDVRNMADARAKISETGADGIMFGRAIFGNPWLFDESKKEATVRERLEAALLLTRIFLDTWQGTKNFDILKKHYQAYVAGFPLAKELRIQMMAAHDISEIEKLILDYLLAHPEEAEIVLGEAPLPHHAR
ncbi:MAG: tRNA-dihydrouridine synthase family protein [Candidatus Moraniibacteriota bacterium]